MPPKIDAVMKELTALGTDAVRDSQASFGIVSGERLGITTPVLKAFARTLGKDHDLALLLWKTDIFEARAIAALIDEPAKVTKKQMEDWAKDFDSWAIVDGCCSYLFVKTAHGWDKAVEWAGRKGEFVKRAGFSLMAYLAVHDKKADDERFHAFFPLMEREAGDDRVYVRKAVNWALRQLGKRSQTLYPLAVATAERIQTQGTKSARWIAADALRELRNEKVKKRLGL